MVLTDASQRKASLQTSKVTHTKLQPWTLLPTRPCPTSTPWSQPKCTAMYLICATLWCRPRWKVPPGHLQEPNNGETFTWIGFLAQALRFKLWTRLEVGFQHLLFWLHDSNPFYAGQYVTVGTEPGETRREKTRCWNQKHLGSEPENQARKMISETRVRTPLIQSVAKATRFHQAHKSPKTRSLLCTLVAMAASNMALAQLSLNSESSEHQLNRAIPIQTAARNKEFLWTQNNSGGELWRWPTTWRLNLINSDSSSTTGHRNKHPSFAGSAGKCASIHAANCNSLACHAASCHVKHSLIKSHLNMLTATSRYFKKHHLVAKAIAHVLAHTTNWKHGRLEPGPKNIESSLL